MEKRVWTLNLGDKGLGESMNILVQSEVFEVLSRLLYGMLDLRRVYFRKRVLIAELRACSLSRSILC